MLEGLSGALGAIKQASPKILASVAIAAAFLLFTPSDFTTKLGMADFVSTYRGYIGLAFLVSLVLLASEVMWWASSTWRTSRVSKHNDKVRLDSLSELTPDEKAYLIPYIQGENTQYYSIEDGVVGGLVAKKMLYQASSIGSIVNGFAFNMQPWARKHLTENPYLLNGAAPPPRSPRAKLGLDW